MLHQSGVLTAEPTNQVEAIMMNQWNAACFRSILKFQGLARIMNSCQDSWAPVMPKCGRQVTVCLCNYILKV